MSINKPHILIIDDELLNLEIITEYLESCNYQISTAIDGDIAWELLEATPDDFDVILLDRMMPKLNGMNLLKRIKEHAHLKHCPVIFQTAKASKSDMLKGLQAGAYYYLTKPFEEEMLVSIVNTAVRDSLHHRNLKEILQQTQQSIGLMKSANFQYKTLDEARNLASLISNACPDPEKIIMGVTELMINAIEHGNLGIGYQEKTMLNDNGTWEEEVSRRLALPENKTLLAEVSFQNKADEISITVVDQGKGFNWKNYLDFDPERITDNHGRGIALAYNHCFSHLEYLGKGNQVRAII